MDQRASVPALVRHGYKLDVSPAWRGRRDGHDEHPEQHAEVLDHHEAPPQRPVLQPVGERADGAVRVVAVGKLVDNVLHGAALRHISALVTLHRVPVVCFSNVQVGLVHPSSRFRADEGDHEGIGDDGCEAENAKHSKP